MARRKSSKNQVIKLISVFFALASLLMIFLPAVKYVIADKALNEFTGIMISFGYTKTAGAGIFEASSKLLEFSALNLLPYLLVLGSLTLILTVSSRKKVFINTIIFIMLIASSVLFFISPLFVASAKIGTLPIYPTKHLQLAIGSILSGVFSALAGLNFLFGMLKK